MSGGHYDYEEFKIRDVTERVANDLNCPPDPERPWMVSDPALAKLVSGLGEYLYGVVHDLDYHICGDSTIGDTVEAREEYREKKVAELRELVKMIERASWVQSRNSGGCR